MKYKLAFVAAAAVAAIATAAYATVTFDPNTGTGFVGKGDLQLAFGWNNAAAQQNIPSVTFTYASQETYTAVCTWTTGEGTNGERVHNVDHNKTVGVSGQVQYSVRQHQQIDGIYLTGFTGTLSESGTVPVVGGPCPGNPGTDGTWSSVTLTSSSGGLYANWGGQSVLLQ